MSQSLKMLLRDWRAGELRVLAMALVIAVASITSVAFFADRVGRALVRDAHQLLGADLVLVSDHAWQPGVAAEIARRGLEHAQATTFISMAIAGENSVLVGVKAVSANYPLRGRLRIAPAVALAAMSSGVARQTAGAASRHITPCPVARQRPSTVGLERS
jgi:putative ABC transport system permease protein